MAGDTAYKRRTAARMAESGVGLVRQSFDWALLEPAPGEFNPEGYDDFVRQLALRRIRALPVLVNPPAHRVDGPRRRGAARHLSPARLRATSASSRPSSCGATARAATSGPMSPRCHGCRSAHGRSGTSPACPSTGARRPDAAEYARLLRVTAAAIRRVDPGAEIVSAGIPESRLGVPFSEYVNDMYDAGAGPTVDALAVHPYARDAEETLGGGRGHPRAAPPAGLRHPDLGDRDRLGRRRPAEPVHRRRAGARRTA